MRPRFVGRLGAADAVTVANAVLGFGAAVAATREPTLAEGLLLVGAVADALDGIVARRYGSSAAGTFLDGLADVVSFGAAPALLVAVTALSAWPTAGRPLVVAAAVVPPALYVGMAVVRLGLYTAYDSDSEETRGVQATLAATILAAGVLAGFVTPAVLVGLTAVLAALMVTRITYPDLHPQDALVMGVVQAVAVVATGRVGEAFAFALLFLALSYLVFAPRFYWRGSL